MTPNNDPLRNLAFWRLEVNASLPQLDPQTKEEVALEAYRLHVNYTGLGSAYGVHAAYGRIASSRDEARSRREAEAAEARRRAEADAFASSVRKAHADKF